MKKTSISPTPGEPTVITEFPGQKVEEYRLKHGTLPSASEPCKHLWPDQPDMNSKCEACGMTFVRHVFTECP